MGDDRGGVSVRVLVAAKHLATYANDILRPLRLVGNGTGAQGHDQRALHLVSEKRQRASVAAPEVPSLLWHSLASRAWPNSQASGRGRDSIGRQGCVAVSQKGPVRTDGLPMTRVRIAGAVVSALMGVGLVIRVTDRAGEPRNPGRPTLEMRLSVPSERLLRVYQTRQT